MTLSEYLQIFEKTYDSRKAEMELSEADQYSLLESRYPLPEVLWGKIPTLSERIEARLKHLSRSESAKESSFTKNDIHLLYRQVFFELKLFRKRGSRFLSLFSVFNACASAELVFPADSETIHSLAECAIDLWIVHKDYRDFVLGDRLDQTAAAAKRLRLYSSEPILIENGDIVFNQAFLLPIQEELERRIDLAGGIPVLMRLFQEELLPHYDYKMSRYMIYRQSRIHYGTKDIPGPETPIGYLFQLSLKHLFPPIVDVRPRQCAGYRSIIEIAKDILLLFEVSKAYSFSHLFLTAKDIPKYVTDNAIFENLCLPPQYSPQFCSFVLSLYEPERRRLLPNLSGIIKVAQWCFSLPPCTTFSADEVCVQTRVPLPQVREILNLFSQPWNQVNKDFATPLSPTNDWKYPLIRTPSPEMYFQLCPHFSGYGFCEQLYSLLRAKEHSIGRTLGRQLEKKVQQQLDIKSIPYHSGYYKNKNSVLGECDLILEDDENILFVELKKHPLGPGFRQAHDIDIFHDMAEGMLMGQVQACQHCAQLKKEGSLALYKNATDLYPYYVLRQNNRNVHAMCICLPEYAFFTQAFLTEKILEMLLTASFHSVDPAQAERLEKLNKVSYKLRKQLGTPITTADSLHQYTHFCYFRSLQQFLLVLHKSQTIEQVIEQITWDQNAMFSAMDFYAGLKAWNRMHQKS